MIIIPSCIFDFTQDVDDYYFPVLTGNYFRLLRMLNIIVTLFATPLYLLMAEGYIPVYEGIRFFIPDTDFAIPLFWQFIILEIAVDGLKLFVFGMALKILLANQLGGLWSDVTTIGFESLSTPLAWMAAFAYSFQLYFDFWGYSLMAIGIGRMLGFHLPENFRCPYLALSMTEFWRRWHITLGTWFREYLYFPLGGSRCSRRRMIFNLLVVWLATGLWHGAHLNFLLWGLGLFGILTVEKLWLKKYLDRWPVLGHLYMLVLIPLSWAVFSVSDLGQLGAYFGRLLPLFSHAAAYPLDFLKYGKTYGVFLVLGLVCSTSLPAYVYRRLKGTWAGAVILAVLFWLCLFCLSKGMNDPFMYFRF